jgi:hypothetical protein
MRNLAASLAVVLFGCSSSVADTPSVSPDQACSELAAAFCDKANSCAAAFVQLEYGDVANCTTRFKASCLVGLNAPSTAQTAADTQACATAAKTATCGALFDNDTPTACLPKSGGLEDGKPCHASSQCKSAFCAIDENKAVCGVCAAKPAAGGKCTTSGCPAPLKCSVDKTCNKPAAIGAACSDSIPCVTGSTCFGMKCVADAGTEGAACDPMAGPSCDGTKGLFCVAKKCIKPAIVAKGAECGFDYDIATMSVKSAKLCEKAGWCKGLNLSAMPPILKGTCEPAAADGEACIADASFEKGPGCMEPAECVGGKCLLSDNATCK